MFESDVVLEGTQTGQGFVVAQLGFESDVVLEGTQTKSLSRLMCWPV